MCGDKKSCITINCGCCGNSNGNDGTPVGTVISYMGISAPEHYLTCDGTIYNIDDFKDFSQFIKNQFGSYDFFGGDGTVTFAVPDLRGEFLRGSGTATRNTGTGTAAGVHQDGTEHLHIYHGTTSKLGINADFNSPVDIFSQKTDGSILSTNTTGWLINAGTTSWKGHGDSHYRSRPTNTAVLYCIKYE